jgi:phosphoribosylaminoimidazole (AIR) synthetase
MGVGMALVVPPSEVRKVLQVLDMNLYRAFEIGEVAPGGGPVRYN